MMCGETNHLTSFALLLSGNDSSYCDSDDEYVYAWLSFAFVAFAIVVCIIVAVCYEIHLAIKRAKKNAEFIEIQTRIQSVKN